MRSLRLLPVAALVAALWSPTHVSAQVKLEDLQHSSVAPRAAMSLLTSVVSDGQRMVAVGERGHALRSIDQGDSWTQLTVPTRAMLSGISSFSATSLVAVGHEQTVLRSTDFGTTWNRVHHVPISDSPLFDVLMLSDQHGVAVGAYGLVLETQDGGLTWLATDLPGEEDRHLYSLAQLKNGTLLAVGESGAILRRKQADDEWQALNPPYQGSFFGSLVCTDGSILIFGLRGHLFRSKDDGDSWHELASNTRSSLYAAIESEPAGVALAGSAGTVLEGASCAGPFTTRTRADRKAMLDLIVSPKGRVLAFGETGFIGKL